MEESYNPKKIKKDYLNGYLSKESATDLLISLIESSDETNVRIESISILKEAKLQNETIFKILENLFLSDEDMRVRASAVKETLNSYLEQGLVPLIWTIDHEKSPLVLKIIFNFFEKSDNSEFKHVHKKISRWFHKFSSNLGISLEESRFFLDLEALFAQDKPYYEINLSSYKFFQKLGDTRVGDPWLLIKKKHVEVLNLNYFNWKYIKENEDIINSFLKLYDLKSYLKTINKYDININNFKIPLSIGKLTNLKKLVLKRNNLKNVPQSINQLQNLKELDLSQNKFNEIPRILGSLNSLEKLNLKNNDIHKIPESMKAFLNSLKEFRI